MPALLQTRRAILSKRRATPQSLATLSAPYNNLIALAPGDSRTGQGGGFSGTYNTGGGVYNNYGWEALVPTMLANRARFIDYQPNPGIGGQVGADALAYPRPISASGSWTGRIDSGTAGTPGNTLTMTANQIGDTIQIGTRISGTGITPCRVTAILTGSGYIGTYTVDGAAQNVASTNTIKPQYVYGQAAAKTIADIAASPAAIILLGPLGTNSSGSAADLAAIDTAIKALTDPTYVHPGYGAVLPLYNGLAKTIILLNDTRTGYSTSGSANAGKTPAATALQFYNYSLSLLKYGFDSGDALANSHVVAIDTFNDPVLADLTDTTYYSCKPGYFADGLHLAPPSAYQVAIRIAAKVAALLPAYDYANLPTTTTASSFVVTNALFTTTTGGTSSLNGLTFTGTIPSSWRLLGATATGLNADLSYNALGGVLGNELVIRITGTPSSNASVTLDQLSSGATINLATDSLRLAWRSKLLVTAGNVYGEAGGLVLQAVSSTSRQITATQGAGGSVAGYGNNSAYPLWIKNAYASADHPAYQTRVTRNVALSQYGETGNPTKVNPYFNLSFQAGVAVDVTLTLSQVGVAKVTN